MPRAFSRGVVTVLALGFLLTVLPGTGDAESTREITVVNIETPQGVKIWEPPSLVVNKGDKVKVKLINMLDLEHGYRIADYKIEKVVPGQKTETIEFTADKAGIFVIDCQLHPAHVPGQLLVLP
jgi:nitrosocyanin